jgi:hypothetical protein
MIPRYIIKRFCHSHTQTFIPNHKSKCYENIHKLNYLIEDAKEIKYILQSYHEPLKIIYIGNIMFGIVNIYFYIFKIILL